MTKREMVEIIRIELIRQQESERDLLVGGMFPSGKIKIQGPINLYEICDVLTNRSVEENAGENIEAE